MIRIEVTAKNRVLNSYEGKRKATIRKMYGGAGMHREKK